MSTAQSSSGFAADAPRYGAEPVAAYYQLNQTGQPTPVESVNGLVGQVVVQLNGTPIVPSGQNINIVAGSGVVGISAGGNTSTGTVPLASADSSVVLTNAGGTGGSINLKSVSPISRATLVASERTSGSAFLIVGGANVASGRQNVFVVTGLTAGKQYLMNIVVFFGIYPGWTASGVTADNFTFLFGSSGTDTSPALSPQTSGGFAYTIVQDFGALVSSIPTGANANITSQTFSCVIVPNSATFTLTTNTSGQTTGSNLTIDGRSFLQLVQLD